MSSNDIIFLKLGGSLLTDKTGVEVCRFEVIDRVALEIHRARLKRPGLMLLIGHGSGSFGHIPAARHGTRDGVHNSSQWQGFAEVSDAAARLNVLVRRAFLAQGVPVITIQPSASARCKDGHIVYLNERTVRLALDAGLVPIVYGDVAFDDEIGGTIISTEEILDYLVDHLNPRWLFLAGETEGVYDTEGVVISHINRSNIDSIKISLGESRGTDVTGGMFSKVLGMIELAERHPALSIRILSGLKEGNIEKVLLGALSDTGTLISNR